MTGKKDFNNPGVVLMAICFWLCASLIFWVYAGYPAILLLLTWMRIGRPVNKDDIEPRVTLMISAYNEGEVIRQKLENCLALDYPRGRLEIMVVSDCSSDGTDAIVCSYEPQGVRLVRMDQRGGKTTGLNQAVPLAAGEIIIFSDANAMYGRMAVRNLVRNFADPQVGCVTGESRYSLDDASQSTASENLYWRYELALKKMESQIGSIVGGDGAIYAIRKKLFRPMQPPDLSDFVNPVQITAQGFRNVYEPEAVSFERGAESFDLEFRRKVRIVSRAWRGIWRVRAVLNPLRSGFFALQIISHKLLRWLIPLFAAAAFVANGFLLQESAVYLAAGFAQAAFYLLALAGWSQAGKEGISRVIYVPYYFCMVNYASLLGILHYYSGKDFTTWQTVREAKSQTIAPYHAQN